MLPWTFLCWICTLVSFFDHAMALQFRSATATDSALFSPGPNRGEQFHAPLTSSTSTSGVLRWGEALHPGPADDGLGLDGLLNISFTNPSGLRNKEQVALSINEGIVNFSETQLSTNAEVLYCPTQVPGESTTPQLACASRQSCSSSNHFIMGWNLEWCRHYL